MPTARDGESGVFLSTNLNQRTFVKVAGRLDGIGFSCDRGPKKVSRNSFKKQVTFCSIYTYFLSMKLAKLCCAFCTSLSLAVQGFKPSRDDAVSAASADCMKGEGLKRDFCL